MSWKLGEGGHKRFWLDNWLGEESLANTHSRLFFNS